MSLTVVLDSGPLGLATNPKETTGSLACYQWIQELLANGTRILLPELADYEIRRELIRAGKTNGLKRLDVFKTTLEYLPISTDAMLLAAEFWAQARSVECRRRMIKRWTATSYWRLRQLPFKLKV